MGRAKKKGTSTSGEFSLFDESEAGDADAEDDLPRDEAGRAKIKHQYVDLLGIRVQKLAGRILNRERINKTLEGIYFVCLRCQKVCHNLDEGLVEDADNKNNICTPCSRQTPDSARAAAKKPAASRFESEPSGTAAKKKAAKARPVAETKRVVVAKPAAATKTAVAAKPAAAVKPAAAGKPVAATKSAAASKPSAVKKK